uniref:CARD domain-containing protein n=1 Tax=Seriola lalandi dorsalis TaxID=1841481 RepID=A0A3B4YT42_SERLL
MFNKTRHLSQAPAAKMIKKHKVELIDCLSADHSFILQHVQARDIVTDREYNHLRHISQPREVVTKLIDIVMGKDQKSIEDFIDLLKESDILCTYPQLEEITRNWYTLSLSSSKCGDISLNDRKQTESQGITKVVWIHMH